MMNPNWILSWIVTYSDGHKVNESQVPYGKLERENLVKFQLFNDFNIEVFSLDLDTDKKLFYRRRGTVPYHWSFYLVGWRSKTQTQIFIIAPDGAKQVPRFESFWNEPEWFPQEQV